jgi:hypothetical protein
VNFIDKLLAALGWREERTPAPSAERHRHVVDPELRRQAIVDDERYQRRVQRALDAMDANESRDRFGW